VTGLEMAGVSDSVIREAAAVEPVPILVPNPLIKRERPRLSATQEVLSSG
jgi:hypothetical protein